MIFDRQSRRGTRAALVGVLLICSACASAPPTLSPAGVTAFNTTRVVKGLDALRDVAILGEQQVPPLISTATTRKVVQYHQATLQTMQALGRGWQAAAQTGLTALTQTLSPEEQRLLGPYLALVSTVLQEVP